MPFIIPFIPLIAAGVGATGLGLQLSGALTPGTPKPSAAPTPTAPNTTPGEQQAKVAAIQSQLPSEQERLGGALSPDALINFGGVNAGVPGQSNLGQIALERWLGLGDTSGLFGGSGSGGGAALGSPSTPGAAPSGGPSLAMFPNEAVPAFHELSGGST